MLFGWATLVMGTIAVMTHMAPPRRWRRLLRHVDRLTALSFAARRATTSYVMPAVHRVSRVAGGANCLVRALTTRTLLAAHDRPAQLVFGVRKTPAGSLCAHAWLMFDGVVVEGGATDPYVALPDLGQRV